MQTAETLRALLARIDRRGYPAYKDLLGRYRFGGYVLGIDHVQGDPYAAPSRLSVRVDAAEAGFPAQLYRTAWQRIALQDALTRRFSRLAAGACTPKGSGHSGLVSVSRCGPEILERTACRLDPASGAVLLRLEVGFPANGRTINAKALEEILFGKLPQWVSASLMYRNLDARQLQAVSDLAVDQHFIRQSLPALGLCAFVADGSVLPRASGVSQRPMAQAVPFQSPPELSVALDLPCRGRITGMGIPQGITLIVGGGYHGKSTLLKALEMGVYNHVAGDGREYVITQDSAVKIRAEDGRSVQQVDVSMFIRNLPNGSDTTAFTTADASGSTSQAAGVAEALESGSRLLLIDEDTSATNFMVRDALMQRVIRRDMEPITPFLERARWLWETHKVSTILVAGSSGAWFHTADHVIQMDRYVPRDITALAKTEARAFPPDAGDPPPAVWPSFRRCPRPQRAARTQGGGKVRAMGRDGVSVDRETIDLRYVEQLADGEQSAALGCCLTYARRCLIDGRRDLRQVVQALEGLIEAEGLEALWGDRPGTPALARPRLQEIFSCFNRCRSLDLG